MKKFLTTTLILILVAITILSGVLIIRDVVSANSNIETPVDPGGETPVEPGGEDPDEPGEEPEEPGGEDPDEPDEPGGEEPEEPGDGDPEDPTPTIDVWDGTSDFSWYNTTDTEFILTTPEQLASLTWAGFSNKTMQYRDITIKLGADMYLNYGDTENFWQPIGTSDYGFSCSFDGQNHTIYGLTVKYDELNSASVSSLGLFGTTTAASISNLNIDGALIDQTGMTDAGSEDLVASTRTAGVLAGYAETDTEINNITIKNSTITGDKYSYVGALAGYYNSNKNIADIAVENISLSGRYVGGLIGNDNGSAAVTFNNLDVDVSVTATVAAGVIGQENRQEFLTIEDANVLINGSADTFTNFVNDKDPIKNNPLVAVIKNSTVTGTISTDNYHEYDGTITKEDNVKNTLTINGTQVVENYFSNDAKFFKGFYTFYNPSVGVNPKYELIVTEDKAIINQVENDNTGYASILVKHIKDYEIKSASHDRTSYFITLESDDGETLIFQFDLTKSNAFRLSTYTGYVGSQKLTAAA